jgi:hypothetical protein
LYPGQQGITGQAAAAEKFQQPLQIGHRHRTAERKRIVHAHSCLGDTHKIQAKPRRTGILAHRQGAGGPVYSGAIMLFTRICPMKRLLTALIALVAVTTLLTGCGQKGPLFLPEDTQQSE